MIDPEIQAILQGRAPSVMGTIPSATNNVSPMIPPPHPQMNSQSLAPNPPPDSGADPIIQQAQAMGLQNSSLNQQPANPSMPKGRIFQDLLGRFLYSFASGLSEAGTGPGANERGAGAAIMGSHNLDLQRQQMALHQQQIQAQAAYQNSQTALNTAETQPVELEGPKGNTIIVPAKIASQLIGPEWKYKTAMAVTNANVAGREAVVNTQTQSRQNIAAGKNQSAENIAAGKNAAAAEQMITVTPEIQKQYNLPLELIGKQMKASDIGALTRGGAMVTGNQIRSRQTDISAGHLTLAQKTFERDTFGTLFGQNIPSSLVDEKGNTMGWKAPSMPTSSIKTQAQQAEDLNVLFNTVRQKVALLNAQGKLGPGAGRISEFMTGKIGADDPDFAELRVLGSLVASGVLKAHFGARGGQGLYQEFQNKLDTGKMTAGDLNGALNGFTTFMTQYAQRVKTAGGSNSNAPTAGTYRNPATGQVIEPDGKGGWRDTVTKKPVGQ